MAASDESVLTEEQKGVVASLRMLEAEMAVTPLSGEQVKAALAELVSPVVLFSPSVVALPYLHRYLRNWLQVRGPNLEQHSSRCIKMKLAIALCPEAEERSVAKEVT